MSSQLNYQTIVVGGGHAGCEAAHACAQMGIKTLLITMDATKIGVLSCNPAIGGLAKSHLAREVDALGGLMGRITDQSGIQYRVLNSKKGPAVQALRVQCDKKHYAMAMQRRLGDVKNLSIEPFEVKSLQIKEGRVSGVILADGSLISARCVIVTSGTFLGAVMHTGESQVSGGRVGESASSGLTEVLQDFGFHFRRLKTGTPPRLHKDSIDWKQCELQPGDPVFEPFSCFERPDPFPVLKQVPCHITYTNASVHEIIRQNLHLSPMVTGAITGAGPRYCPSIEDKVERFSDRDRHQVFLEPEGLDVDDVYVNGVSTSLPASVQEAFIHRIPGLEHAKFIRHGYAVEYDALDATALKRTMETKNIPGLFFAGQVNGTSGYEEAAGQGIIAGINAALSVLGGETFVLGRDDAYIGVMIDDLTLRGLDEPYRMFTSRAEFRLLLREENADERLSARSFDIGFLKEGDFALFEEKKAQKTRILAALEKAKFNPSDEKLVTTLLEAGYPTPTDRLSGTDLMKRPNLSADQVFDLCGLEQEKTSKAAQCVVNVIRYEGYIKREEMRLRSLKRQEEMAIPKQLDFEQVHGLSNEARSRLGQVRPETLGQMSRLPGITPSAVAQMLIHLKKKNVS